MDSVENLVENLWENCGKFWEFNRILLPLRGEAGVRVGFPQDINKLSTSYPQVFHKLSTVLDYRAQSLRVRARGPGRRSPGLKSSIEHPPHPRQAHPGQSSPGAERVTRAPGTPGGPTGRAVADQWPTDRAPVTRSRSQALKVTRTSTDQSRRSPGKRSPVPQRGTVPERMRKRSRSPGSHRAKKALDFREVI
jgi:hypothetical protein